MRNIKRKGDRHSLLHLSRVMSFENNIFQERKFIGNIQEFIDR